MVFQHQLFSTDPSLLASANQPAIVVAFFVCFALVIFILVGFIAIYVKSVIDSRRPKSRRSSSRFTFYSDGSRRRHPRSLYNDEPRWSSTSAGRRSSEMDRVRRRNEKHNDGRELRGEMYDERSDCSRGQNLRKSCVHCDNRIAMDKARKDAAFASQAQDFSDSNRGPAEYELQQRRLSSSRAKVRPTTTESRSEEILRREETSRRPKAPKGQEPTSVHTGQIPSRERSRRQSNNQPDKSPYELKCRKLLQDIQRLKMEATNDNKREPVIDNEEENNAEHPLFELRAALFGLRKLFEKLTSMNPAMDRATQAKAMTVCCNMILEFDALPLLKSLQCLDHHIERDSQFIIETVVPNIWSI